MAAIHLIRHGQASFGAADYDSLSALGERQAALLGHWFARTGLQADVLVSGALKRHRTTATACIAAWGHDRACGSDAGFDEYDADDILACARPDLATHQALGAFLAASDDARRAFHGLLTGAAGRWIGGTNDAEYRESWPAFSARCRDALLRLAQAAGERSTLVVFTSAGVIGTLCQQALGLPAPQALELSWVLRNTSITTLRTRGGAARLDTFNALGHLQAEGDPALLTYR